MGTGWGQDLLTSGDQSALTGLFPALALPHRDGTGLTFGSCIFAFLQLTPNLCGMAVDPSPSHLSVRWSDTLPVSSALFLPRRQVDRQVEFPSPGKTCVPPSPTGNFPTNDNITSSSLTLTATDTFNHTSPHHLPDEKEEKRNE